MNYTPNQSPLVDPSAIYDSLSCGRRGCRCGRRSGLTHCPAHDDIHPSLSVKVTDGTVLLHCFANCPQDAVLDALAVRGIELRRGRLPAPTEPADVYGYCDENGKLLFQVVRFPGKRCRQRRPCPQGGAVTRAVQGTRMARVGIGASVARALCRTGCRRSSRPFTMGGECMW